MRRNNKIYALSVIALMLAIMLIFGFTPIGTISTFGLTITLMGIPVAILACLYGPWIGLLAGFIWGTISIIQAFTGMDATATLILSAPDDVIPAAVKFSGLICLCYSRVIVGFLSGLIFDLLKRVEKKGILASYVASFSTAILNTVIFMLIFWAFFYNTPTIQDFCVNAGLDPDNFFLFATALVGVNFIAELSTNGLVGGSVTVGIIKAAEKLQIASPFKRFFVKKQSEEEN